MQELAGIDSVGYADFSSPKYPRIPDGTFSFSVASEASVKAQVSPIPIFCAMSLGVDP